MCQQVSENIERHSLHSAARGDGCSCPNTTSPQIWCRTTVWNLVFNCATSQHVVQYKCDAKSLICRICLSNKLSSVSYVYADKFKILQHGKKNCLPSAHMHASLRQVHAIWQWMREWRIVKFLLLKNIVLTLNDVSSTQKISRKLKINLSTRNIS